MLQRLARTTTRNCRRAQWRVPLRRTGAYSRSIDTVPTTTATAGHDGRLSSHARFPPRCDPRRTLGAKAAYRNSGQRSTCRRESCPGPLSVHQIVADR